MATNNPFVRRPRTEYVRLTGLSLWIPTEEQLEKADATAISKGRTKPAGQKHVRKPSISLRVEGEPLSYRLEGGKLGNVTLKYFEMTYGLDDEVVEAAREFGLAGIPANRIITASLKGSPEEQDRPFSRWLKYLMNAGFELEPTEDGASITSDAIGKVFKVQEGEDTFPSSRFDNKTKRWVSDGTYAVSNLQYFIEAAPDYVQDPESVRVIQIRSRDEESDEAAVSAITGGVGIAGQLKEAVKASGLVGRNKVEFANPRQALAFCDGAIGTAPILVSDSVNEACVAGNFIGFLVEQGAVVVTDDGTLMGVE